MVVDVVRLTADENMPSDPMSMRGRRRDKKARSAAAEALLNMNDPPKEIRFLVVVAAMIATASRSRT